jgi:hypothetical protein
MRETPICIPNIGPRGRQRRLIGGAAWLAVGAAAAIVLGSRGTSAAWLATLAIPFTIAALMYFQARERT